MLLDDFDVSADSSSSLLESCSAVTDTRHEQC